MKAVNILCTNLAEIFLLSDWSLPLQPKSWFVRMSGNRSGERVIDRYVMKEQKTNNLDNDDERIIGKYDVRVN